MAKSITTLTFDLWNTLYAASGPQSELARGRRLQLLSRVLASRGIHPSEDELRAAYRAAFDAYLAAWTGGAHFGAREHVAFVLEHFHARPAESAGERQEFEQVVHETETAAYLAPPVLLPGVSDTVPRLAAQGYRLGIISDTSLTPGRILRDFLEWDRLLGCFSVLTFSDDTGFPKPDRRMFELTLAGLDARPNETAHVGDTPRTDIAGAQALGITTIRCAAVADHDGGPEADFVIRDHSEIPGILERLRE